MQDWPIPPIFQNFDLTLSPPRGGEISPPPTKIEIYSFKDVSIFFNLWLFFQLIPLTNPSKVRFLVYYKKNFRNLRSKISSQPLFGLKLEKKSGFMILWLNKLHLFVININFTLIQMHFEVNNLFSCWTESKAALEKTFQEGRDLYGSSQFFQLFQQYFWSFTDYKHCEWSYFWFGRHLKHCVYQLAHN